nr:hypothetical protein [Tanacetum cinerariifolium]
MVVIPKQSYELTVIEMLDSKPIEVTRNLKLEAEYIATSEAAKEAVWIRKFIDELDVVPSNNYPIKMNCDNSAAIIMTKESGIQKGDNLDDLCTKALAGPKLTRHARSMGLRLASSFM